MSCTHCCEILHHSCRASLLVQGRRLLRATAIGARAVNLYAKASNRNTTLVNPTRAQNSHESDRWLVPKVLRHDRQFVTSLLRPGHNLSTVFVNLFFGCECAVLLFQDCGGLILASHDAISFTAMLRGRWILIQPTRHGSGGSLRRRALFRQSCTVNVALATMFATGSQRDLAALRI